MSDTFALFLAQATSVTPAPAPSATPDPNAGNSFFGSFIYILPMLGLIYFMILRPQSQAKKKQEETLKSVKTGDKVVTTSGIHGVITNVKDTTVIVKVADNVKLEIEKTHLDKINRVDGANPEKTVAIKA